MNYKELFKNITTVVLDVDGVLTNGEVLLMPGMAPVRKMHSKDGYALQIGSSQTVSEWRLLPAVNPPMSKNVFQD